MIKFLSSLLKLCLVYLAFLPEAKGRKSSLYVMRHLKCFISWPASNILRTQFVTKISQWRYIIINNDLSHLLNI